jgi:hypothetical protein
MAKSKVQPKRFVDALHQLKGHVTERRADTFDGDSANLLYLRLGVDTEAGLLSAQEHLERVHMTDVACHRHHSHNTSA